jgi:hypothetical protein
MTIKVTELLELLSKADKLGFSYSVKEFDDDYLISFYEMFNNGGFKEKVTITKEGKSEWGVCSVPFDYMVETLDAMLKQKEEEKIKEEKRKELIARLSDEEKELLGVK